jgi:tRNA(Ile2) C34 agmatinyltransferase TiaS
MRVFIGFDDTDYIGADQGTGKLARWFENDLPEGCNLEGVLRQQLLVHEHIPYTSHNSAACLVINTTDASLVETLTEKAIIHLQKYALDGSDPGICIACNSHNDLSRLIAFGHACTSQIMTQREAVEATVNCHLSGHGGTNDGIIGAAAAVGLTASGWSGRFIEYGRLRELPEQVQVKDLEGLNIQVVSIDRDAQVPAPEDLVYTKGWLRPRLLGNRPALIVIPKNAGGWESVGEKRNHKQP